jgi:CopG family transcriptional regulator, nickel-responsive regulator
MNKIERKSIAFNQNQLKEFDESILNEGYKSRSEALRDLIRDYLIDKRIKNKNHFAMGTLTFIYDHHAKDIQYELTHLQHHHDVVKSSIHVHVDSKNCMEVLILEGKIKEIETLSKKIITMKGVEHGKLVLTGPLNKFKRKHTHTH